jgi:hypothetical protein
MRLLLIPVVGILYTLLTNAIEPLCRVPVEKCSSLTGQGQIDCEVWSGCQFISNNCDERPSCNPMKCAMSDIAIRLAGKVLPSCVRGEQTKCDAEMDQASSALGLAENCYIQQPYRVSQLGNEPNYVKTTVDGDSRTIFVDYNGGVDTNSGISRDQAVKTLAQGLLLTRQMSGTDPKQLVLLPGKHRITETIALGPADSFLTIQGETGAIITAAVSLEGINWISTTVGGISCYAAELPKAAVDQFDTLSVLSYNEEPAIRAQFPNKNNFIEFEYAGKSGIDSWSPRPQTASVTNRKRVRVLFGPYTRYQFFVSASKGTCNGVFTPPQGYFCDPQYSDADLGCVYSIPGSATLKLTSFNQLKLASWQDRSTAFLHTLHPLKWGGWTFQLAQAANPSDRKLSFSMGGFQEARGDCKAGGGDWYIENALELLDWPNEFFLHLNDNKVFFLPPNGEDISGIADSKFEIGSKITRLIQIIGSSSNPTKNVRLVNLQFERTYPSHMKPHETPSGGDWAIHRSGTVYLEGVENILIADCVFTKLGSHAIFASNYVRNLQILRNNFYALDGSAIMLAGDPKFSTAQPWDRRFDPDYISTVLIRNNVISEIGLMEIQSAGIFGTLAKDIVIERNVIYNGPRAAVVFNDLFGGNLITRDNVMFNMVRLTLDHGPYNVWDRQQWLLPADFRTLPNIVERNFLIGTDGGPKVIDPDDGARNHIVRNNVISFGFMKLKGARHDCYNNIIVAALNNQVSCVYIGNYHERQSKFKWSDNTCYTTSARIVPYDWALGVRFMCDRNILMSSDNNYLGTKPTFGLCSTSTARWQKVFGQDRGSTFQTAIRPVSEVAQACEQLMASFAT